MNPKRIFFLTLGFISLALGIVGAFLPVLPTTPFLILAAFAFSKSSEKWHQWLLNAPTFGPVIRDWEAHGVIQPRAKQVATVLICLSFASLVLWAKVAMYLKILLVSVAVSVLVFLWTRPSHPKKDVMSTKNH